MVLTRSRAPSTSPTSTGAGGGVATGTAPGRRTRSRAASQRLVSTGFSYDPGLREPSPGHGNLLPRIRDIRRIGSSALDLCNVGEGAVDAYVEEGVNYWDHAAGGPGGPDRRGPHRATREPGAST